jgi:hypothetical protein
MSTAIVDYPAGGYRYLGSAGFAFSSGVVAADGYALVRARLHAQPALSEGFAVASAWLRSQGLPPAALAACELRSPAAMTLDAFRAFNDVYLSALHAHGFGARDAFPIARSNLAPRYCAPAEATLYAFTYAVPLPEGTVPGSRDFVISGMPELAADGSIIARDNVSPAGLEEKCSFVIEVLRERVEQLGCRWGTVTGANIYTVHSLDPILPTLAGHGLAAAGITLIPSYPPVVGLEFEADVRAVHQERTI